MNHSITFEKIAIKIYAIGKRNFSPMYIKRILLLSFESKSGHQNLFIILDKLHLYFPCDRRDHVEKNRNVLEQNRKSKLIYFYNYLFFNKLVKHLETILTYGISALPLLYG